MLKRWMITTWLCLSQVCWAGFTEPYLTYWQEYGPAVLLPSKPLYGDLNQGIIYKTTTNLKTDIVVLAMVQNVQEEIAIQEIFKQQFGTEHNISFNFYPTKADYPKEVLRFKNAKVIGLDKIKYLETQETLTLSTYRISTTTFFTGPEIYQPRSHVLFTLETPSHEIFRYLTDGVEIAAEIYDMALELKGLRHDGQGANASVGEVLSKMYGVDPNSWYQFVTHSKVTHLKYLLTAFPNKKLF